MRIAILADHPPFTGIGNYSFKLFKHLRTTSSEEVDLHYLSWSTRDWKPLEEQGVKIITASKHLPVRSPSFYRSQFRTPVPRGYDVYHATHPLLCNVSPSPAKSVVTVEDLLPMVIPRNYPIIFGLQFRSQIQSIRRMKRIIVISQSTRLDVERLLGIPSGSVDTIPFGVDEDFTPGPSVRDELGIHPDAKVLLHVGSEEKRKNIPFLFQVFARLKNRLRDVVLIRVGSSRLENRRLLKSMSLEKDVVYTGWQTSREVLRAYYRSSDLLLFPSTHEGFGFPPLEAMACGCPVIVSATTSLPEIAGKGGIQLPLNAELWAQEAYKLLSDDRRRAEMSQACIRQSRDFSWPVVAQQTLRIYREIA